MKYILYKLKFIITAFVFLCTQVFLLAEEQKSQFECCFIQEVESRKGGGDFIYIFKNKKKIDGLFSLKGSIHNNGRIQLAHRLLQGNSIDIEDSEKIEANNLVDLLNTFSKERGVFLCTSSTVQIDSAKEECAIELDLTRIDLTGVRYWIFAKLSKNGKWTIISYDWVLTWD